MYVLPAACGSSGVPAGSHARFRVSAGGHVLCSSFWGARSRLAIATSFLSQPAPWPPPHAVKCGGAGHNSASLAVRILSHSCSNQS